MVLCAFETKYHNINDQSLLTNTLSMGKMLQLKSKILKFLPQAISTINFTNTLTSPRISTSSGKGLTSPRPIISIIPAEARRRPKNASFEAKEPTSPKVTCFGQVNKKKSKAKKRVCPPPPPGEALLISCPKEVKKPKPKPPSLSKLLKRHKKCCKNDSLVDNKQPVSPERVGPSLGQMMKLSSARGALSNFEWTDEEGKEGIGGEEGDEQVIVPFSALIEVREIANVQSNKEVNLWKRRDIAPPLRLCLS